MKKRAVFFDRDDTLIRNIPYLNDPSGVELFQDTRDALLALQGAGWLIFIVSNQSGIGRGLCTDRQVRAVNEELERQIAPVVLSGIYYSPHTPEQPSETRKPAPGLLFQAAAEHGVSLPDSVMVGDKTTDVECGENAGCKTVWLAYDEKEQPVRPADFTARSLTEAVGWILGLP